jgi:hypothetical protein
VPRWSAELLPQIGVPGQDDRALGQQHCERPHAPSFDPSSGPHGRHCDLVDPGLPGSRLLPRRPARGTRHPPAEDGGTASRHVGPQTGHPRASSSRSSGAKETVLASVSRRSGKPSRLMANHEPAIVRAAGLSRSYLAVGPGPGGDLTAGPAPVVPAGWLSSAASGKPVRTFLRYREGWQRAELAR